MKIKSLQKRLFSNYVISIILGFTLFGFVLFGFLTYGLYKKIDGALTAESKWIENTIMAKMSDGEEEVVEEISEHMEPKGDDQISVIFSQDQKIVYVSQNPENENFLFEFSPQLEIIGNYPIIRTIKIDKTNTFYRVLAKKIFPSEGNEYILALGLSLSDVRVIQGQLVLWLLIIIPLIGAAFALWARFFAVKISQPLEIMSDQAKRITVNQLTQSIEIPSSYKEIKDLADSFNEMIRRLDRSISEIKRFTSDASHELRTPLSVLKSQMQLSLRDNATPLQYRKTFENELEEVQYMEKIVDNLLTLSRYDSGKIKLDNTIVDLSDLLIEQCEKINPYARGKNVSIVLETIQPVQISGDKMYLAQMIFNLLDNAVKYNKDAGQVCIDLKSMQKNGSCLLKIRDTGLGIPKTDLPNIFDRFYRVDKSRSREIMGSGLGLSIAKLIVELHEGEVTIESEENKGTTVIVSLPLSSQIS